MAWSWIFDGPGIAKEVKNATRSTDNGANRECPKCQCRIDNSDVALRWPGLPAGVKFDPSDAEIMEHLAAKCGVGNSNPHAFIDEFIPTLDQEKGICYTHPENLPGAKKDGTSIHFFHKTTNAYATGQRKRRKIQSDSSSNEGPVRWHKTGKTKPVMDSYGVQRGFKKIMVLYKSSKKGIKPDKSKWVMHQYHLGADEDEKEGEYVVSKVLYQQHKQDDKNDDHQISNKSNALITCALPRTPNPNPPNPPRRGKSSLFDDLVDDIVMQSSVQEQEIAAEASHIPTTAVQLEDDIKNSALLAGESRALENSDFDIDDALLCRENINSSQYLNNSGQNPVSNTAESRALENSDFDIDDALLCRENINSSQYLNNSGQNPVSNIGNSNQMIGNGSGPCSIADLENLEFDSPPDFTDLHFGSQDSLLDWINRF